MAPNALTNHRQRSRKEGPNDDPNGDFYPYNAMACQIQPFFLLSVLRFADLC